jgi:hypothetical protein
MPKWLWSTFKLDADQPNIRKATNHFKDILRKVIQNRERKIELEFGTEKMKDWNILDRLIYANEAEKACFS